MRRRYRSPRLRFARRESGLRSKRIPGASTTSLFERHPVAACTVTGDSIAMDRAYLIDAQASLQPLSGFAPNRRAHSRHGDRHRPRFDGTAPVTDHSMVLETCRDHAFGIRAIGDAIH